mmetsp:Transcript_7093/g.20194  ORF Transcript_7093/g.20194 Transcript_7093/m.20194 type:complete len:302 (-) Transcript_7093:74-979(-)
MSPSAQAALACVLAGVAGAIVDTCPGSLVVEGYGNVSLVAAEWNTPNVSAAGVQALGGTALPDMWGRAYMADACTPGEYNNSDYLALRLLGKRLTYTTDVSRAGCGCNAALYLVSMRQNDDESGCFDYYCDANNVCGVRCVEIDIQESNKHAWHSTLHTADDGAGVSAGYGGEVSNNSSYAFGPEAYGPGAGCVDTSQPFEVSVAFPVGPSGRLRGMEVILSQRGSACDARLFLGSYGEDPSFEALSRALEEGMTPVLSYWKSTDMLWLDGRGDGSAGPCAEDTAVCGAAPQFYGFRVESL